MEVRTICGYSDRMLYNISNHLIRVDYILPIYNSHTNIKSPKFSRGLCKINEFKRDVSNEYILDILKIDEDLIDTPLLFLGLTITYIPSTTLCLLIDTNQIYITNGNFSTPPIQSVGGVRRSSSIPSLWDSVPTGGIRAQEASMGLAMQYRYNYGNWNSIRQGESNGN